MTNLNKIIGIAAAVAVAAIPVWVAVALLPDDRDRTSGATAATVSQAIDMFKDRGFDPRKDLRSAEPELPPVFLAELPEDMKAVPDSRTRKTVFVSIVLPHVLHANDRLRKDRLRLQRLDAALQKGQKLRSRDRRWLVEMSTIYRTKPMDTRELLKRVDIVPPRLAVAQAAQESGWGTSRFAQAGNALFGQHAPVGAGSIRAAGDRNVALKAFDNLQSSVRDYMRNLNRHRAYRGFRDARAGLRRSGRPLDADILVGALRSYSEEGALYVTRLRNLMAQPEIAAVKNARVSVN